MQSRTLYQFDNRVTAKMFGYKDATDYYTHASPYNKLNKIKVPTLCLNAADDPFAPLPSKFSTFPLPLESWYSPSKSSFSFLVQLHYWFFTKASTIIVPIVVTVCWTDGLHSIPFCTISVITTFEVGLVKYSYKIWQHVYEYPCNFVHMAFLIWLASVYVNVHVTETLILISMHGGRDFFYLR